MKEHPISFTTESIRAILSGVKTQTRRVIKPQPDHCHIFDGVLSPIKPNSNKTVVPNCSDQIIPCRYGDAGDRLWVKETYGFGWESGHGFYSAIPPTGKEKEPEKIFYKADPEWADYDEDKGQLQWRNLMFMPRFASRILLDLKARRAERLQDISRSDAQAEGVLCACCKGYHSRACSCVDLYLREWDKINAARGYSVQSNPYVWALTFKLTPPSPLKQRTSTG